MVDSVCEDCGLVYSTTPYYTKIQCNSALGGKPNSYHDVANGSFYIWESWNFSSTSIGGGFIGALRPGGGLGGKTKVITFYLSDYQNNLSDVEDIIGSYLTKNTVTEKVIIVGTFHDLSRAGLIRNKSQERIQSIRFIEKLGISLEIIVSTKQGFHKAKDL